MDMAVVDVDLKQLEAFCAHGADEITEALTNIGMPVEGGEPGSIIVEVTPNRPDLFSIEGLSRAIRAYCDKEVREYTAEKSDFVMGVSKKTADARPAVAAAVVKGAKIDEAALLNFMQLQEKLHDTIGRKRKKVAIGLHDLAKVEWPLEYTVAMGDRFVPLESTQEMDAWEVLKKHPKGIAYAHLVDRKAVVIKDKRGVISFPPVINSERTRVTTKTKDILVDVTGTSQETVDSVLNIVATALADRGGSVYEVVVGGRVCPDFGGKKVKIRYREANSVLGVELGNKEIEGALLKMGVRCSGGEALIPPYRVDVISFTDVLEDIAIGYGYGKFKPTLPSLSGIGKGNEFEGEIQGIMCGMGFMEIKTHILTNKEKLSRVGRESGALGIKNSASEEFTCIRTSLLPGLLGCFSNNKMKGLPQLFYEMGVVYGEKEEKRICFGVVGEGASLNTIQPYLQTLLKERGKALILKEAGDACFVGGRCAKVFVGGKEVGVVGSVHPKVLSLFGLEHPAAACEISTDALL